MTAERQRTGIAGEDAAAGWYRDLGYRELARNWRCSIGEIDLVLGRGDTIVFCEVKTRTGSRFGGGWEAVTAHKRQKLRALAQTFLLVHRLTPGTVRFDVASVVLRRAGPSAPRPAGTSSQVEIFQDAF